MRAPTLAVDRADAARQRLRRVCAWLCLLGLLAGTAHAEELEYRVKAAYVYKFVSYVQWPASDADAPFVVGIVDASRMHEELSALVARHGLAGRDVQVKRLRSGDDPGEVHVLFVGRSETQRLADWSHAERSPLLLVSEMPGALSAGSMINFVEVDRRIRFEVNQAAAERAGLKLSARLLSAALHVQKE